jgi:hypothetical protein
VLSAGIAAYHARPADQFLVAEDRSAGGVRDSTGPGPPMLTRLDATPGHEAHPCWADFALLPSACHPGGLCRSVAEERSVTGARRQGRGVPPTCPDQRIAAVRSGQRWLVEIGPDSPFGVGGGPAGPIDAAFQARVRCPPSLSSRTAAVPAVGDTAMMRAGVRTVVSAADPTPDSHVHVHHRRPRAVMSTAVHG